MWVASKTDVLVVGSVLLDFTTAIKIAKQERILRSPYWRKEDESNTRYAQGGVAAVWNDKTDTFEKHIADTLDAGDGL